MSDQASTQDQPALASGTFSLGGQREVHRLGYGAMQITGEGIWGEPPDRDEAIAVLRRAAELGVDFFDTADSYGPFVSEDLIREALHPYDGLTIATKGGLTRTGPGEWHQLGRPEYLRQCIEMSLRRLDLETIPLYQLHRIDSKVPAAEQFGVLKEAQEAGKIERIGLSEVSVEQITEAGETIAVDSVQNMFNLISRGSEEVLEHCERERIGFIPWFPIATGQLAGEGGPLDEIAAEHGASPSQLALAWLLRRSDVILPIPGTKSVDHVEENIGAAAIELSDEEFERIDAAGREEQA